MNYSFSPTLGFDKYTTNNPSVSAFSQLDQIVSKIASRLGSKALRNGNVYDLDVPTEGGRAQHVLITVAVSPPNSGKRNMLYYYSEIGKVTQNFYKVALEMNMKVPFGAFALLNDVLVMVDTQLLDTVDEDEMLLSISSLAVHADRAEKEIFGSDKDQK